MLYLTKVKFLFSAIRALPLILGSLGRQSIDSTHTTHNSIYLHLYLDYATMASKKLFSTN